MRERLRSEWFTAAAVLLLLFGTYVLDSLYVTIAAAVLVFLSIAFMRTDRVRGGSAAVIGLAIAAALVVALRLTR